MAGQPVLNLDTFDDRTTVIVNGVHYRLWTIDILPPLDNHRVRRFLKRNDELAQKEELSDADIDELAGPAIEVPLEDGDPPGTNGATTKTVRRGGLFEKCVRIILDAPDEIQQALNDKQRAEIIRAFQMPSPELLLLTKLLAAANAPSPTGATSPPDSAGSTTAPADPSTS